MSKPDKRIEKLKIENYMKTRVGIIGYGKQGQIRHNAIQETGCAEVVAISEPSAVKVDLPNLSHDEL